MKGSCLCGAVTYAITPPFTMFQYCHCSRCRKVTGSAHAANLFVAPEQFQWLQGEERVGRFEHPEAKYYATGFCTICGSNLPWAPKGGKIMVVPAGSLDEDPGIKPSQNLFWASRASWHVASNELPSHAEMPPRR